jgi:hypothetical protein
MYSEWSEYLESTDVDEWVTNMGVRRLKPGKVVILKRINLAGRRGEEYVFMKKSS